VAVIEGLPPGQSEDRLKALGAAAASSGAVAMFHVAGSTPEADLRADAPLVELISLAELRAARNAVSTGAGERLAAVSLGTPHASTAELERYAALLAGRTIHPDVEMLVSTGRDVLESSPQVAAELQRAGVEVLTDTCSYIAPILRPADGAVMTDSAKWAYYAPGNVGRAVILGATEECVASAVAGRVVRDDAPWGGAT
jgi:predicted aconitase